MKTVEIKMSGPEKILAIARNHTKNSVYSALEELVFAGSDRFSFQDVVEQQRLHGPSLQRVLYFALTNNLISDFGDGSFGKITQAPASVSIQLFELLLDQKLMSEMAESAIVQTDSRLLAHSATISYGTDLGVFVSERGRIQLSRDVGPLLQDDSKESMRLWIRNFVSVSSKVLTPTCIIAAIKTGEVQWKKAFGSDVSNPFDLLKDYPELFSNLMEGMHQANVTDAVFITPKIDVSTCRTVLDIGGASGALGLALCEHYKNIESYCIYDLHTAVDLYKSMNARYRGHSKAPINYVPGDFFKSTDTGFLYGLEPLQKFDTIILGWIIHDWNDEQSIEILSKARFHLHENGKLILLEAVLPDSRQGPVTMLDLTMLLQTGGQERTVGEYANLLKQSGLVLTEVIQTEGRRQIIVAGL